MPTQRTRGTVRAGRGNAVFRILFGLLFVGLGISQFSRFPNSPVPYFTLAIGGLFTIYGIWALFRPKALGSKLDLETDALSAADRIAELTRLKGSGMISEQEFETKRQEILKDL